MFRFRKSGSRRRCGDFAFPERCACFHFAASFHGSRRRLGRFLLPYWSRHFFGGSPSAWRIRFRVDRSAIAQDVDRSAIAQKIGRPAVARYVDRLAATHYKDPGRVFESILHFLRSLFDPEGLKELIRSGGAPLICGIVFIETGFFVGFFLPGDSLLITTGIFAAAASIPLPTVMLHWLLPVIGCAIIGDQLGYWIGRSAGPALYKREDSFFFRRSHLQRAHDFYEKYGGRAVILARFVPIVRTFCPPVAGAACMPYARYLTFDIFGGILWVTATILGGYTLGRSVPNIGKYIHYVIGVVVVLSLLPAILGILKSNKSAPQPAARTGKN